MLRVEKRLKEDEILKEDELAAQRQKNIEYQNIRKERLEELGEYKISIRLNGADYEKLAELCEIIGYRRPQPGMRNLIETLSGAMKYLIREEKDSKLYQPKSPAAKELYNLYKAVSHLKYDLGLEDKKIMKKLNEENVRTPINIVADRDGGYWKVKSITRLLDKKILMKRLSELDSEDE